MTTHSKKAAAAKNKLSFSAELTKKRESAHVCKGRARIFVYECICMPFHKTQKTVRNSIFNFYPKRALEKMSPQFLKR